MGGAIKAGSLYCTAHKMKITEYMIQTRNCLKGCKHVATVIQSKSWERKQEKEE